MPGIGVIDDKRGPVGYQMSPSEPVFFACQVSCSYSPAPTLFLMAVSNHRHSVTQHVLSVNMFTFLVSHPTKPVPELLCAQYVGGLLGHVPQGLSKTIQNSSHSEGSNLRKWWSALVFPAADLVSHT